MTARAAYPENMEFTLAHGTENDFVVIPDLDDELEISDVLVRALTHRRRGLGADGVIRIGSGGDDADAFMDYRNADGSRVQMCGNGVRVTTKYVVDHGLVSPDADEVVRIATRAGVKPVTITRRHDDGTVAEVAVEMGTPVFEPHLVPFEADDPSAAIHPIELDGLASTRPDGGAGRLDVGVVSMGNPHAVAVVDDVDDVPVSSVGATIERHRRFPEQVNVGFVEVVGDDALRLRVWERGVGETSACGTGACAAVAVLHRRGAVSSDVNVRLAGGTLHIGVASDGRIVLTGPAVEVCHGELDERWLASARRGEMEDGH